MKSRKSLFIVVGLLFAFGITAGIYSASVSGTGFQRQSVPFFVLQSSEAYALSRSFVRDLAVSPKNDRGVYLSRQDTQDVTVINEARKVERITSTPFSVKALAVNSQGHILVAGNSELRVSDSKGNGLNSFTIPASTTSFAALNDGGVVVAATDSDGLLTVFDASGKAKNKLGTLKQLDKSNAVQNRFLNSGKVTANQSGDIYYVSMFSPTPLVQKFSKQGDLLKEFAIEGAAVELQLKGAKEFLEQRKLDCVGGYYVVRAATVDPTNGHLWIGINGSSEKTSIRPEAGVLYEYNSDGEKLAEYALSVSSLTGETDVITDVKEVAVNFPYTYVLTSAGKVYRFNLSQRLAASPKQQQTKKENQTFSFVRAVWNSAFAPEAVAAAQTTDRCPLAQPFPCSANCPVGSTPASVSCENAVKARKRVEDRVVYSSCENSGTTGENGGCNQTVRLCDETDGVTASLSLELRCNAAPTPTPTPTGGGDGGPNTCEGAQTQGACLADLTADGCWNTAVCGSSSPVLVDVAGNGFNLTDNANGAAFDLNRDGTREQLSWTAADSDDAWLALDRNGNSVIDDGSELFGNFTWQFWSQTPNGFNALAWFDRTDKGGNGDGIINADDPVFSNLRLWQDRNHNGVSESNELFTLPQLDIVKIELDYKKSKRTDEHGNEFRYRAKVWDARGARVGRWAWDVFLVNTP